jgi:NADPH-dependent ferric siderophore reductase
MAAPSRKERLAQLRREPPRFRRATLSAKVELTSRMMRVTLVGEQLDDLVIDEPASSVRLLVPSPPSDDLVMPEWNGNEFLLADGSRPAIRTFTPPFKATRTRTIDLDLVLHEGGAASAWARRAEAGAAVALSGPGRGFTVDQACPAFLLLGDETAIPAIRQLLTVLPPASVEVHVEVASPDARLDLDEPEGVHVEWHDLPAGNPPGNALVTTVESADIATDGHVWAAGEAAAVHRIRRHLFDEVGLPRTSATVRGYWKQRT